MKGGTEIVKPGSMPTAPLASLVLLRVPALVSALMLALAVLGGDAVDDSLALLLGAPALTGALVSFAFARRRGRRPTVAVRWALSSAVASSLLFGLVFGATVTIMCATRATGCFS